MNADHYPERTVWDFGAPTYGTVIAAPHEPSDIQALLATVGEDHRPYVEHFNILLCSEDLVVRAPYACELLSVHHVNATNVDAFNIVLRTKCKGLRVRLLLPKGTTKREALELLVGKHFRRGDPITTLTLPNGLSPVESNNRKQVLLTIPWSIEIECIKYQNIGREMNENDNLFTIDMRAFHEVEVMMAQASYRVTTELGRPNLPNRSKPQFEYWPYPPAPPQNPAQ